MWPWSSAQGMSTSGGMAPRQAGASATGPRNPTGCRWTGPPPVGRRGTATPPSPWREMDCRRGLRRRLAGAATGGAASRGAAAVGASSDGGAFRGDRFSRFTVAVSTGRGQDLERESGAVAGRNPDPGTPKSLKIAWPGAEPGRMALRPFGRNPKSGEEAEPTPDEESEVDQFFSAERRRRGNRPADDTRPSETGQSGDAGPRNDAAVAGTGPGHRRLRGGRVVSGCRRPGPDAVLGRIPSHRPGPPRPFAVE